MCQVSILFLSIALVSGGLCFAHLPVPAASLVKELAACSLAYSAIVAVAYRSDRKPKWG